MKKNNLKLVNGILILLIIYAIVYLVDIFSNVLINNINDLLRLIFCIVIYIVFPLFYFYQLQKGHKYNCIFLLSIVVPFIIPIINFRFSFFNILAILTQTIFVTYFIIALYRLIKNKFKLNVLILILIIFLIFDYSLTLYNVLKISDTNVIFQVILLNIVMIYRMMLVVYFKNEIN